jgi:hypothetical protein
MSARCAIGISGLTSGVARREPGQRFTGPAHDGFGANLPAPVDLCHDIADVSAPLKLWLSTLQLFPDRISYAGKENKSPNGLIGGRFSNTFARRVAVWKPRTVQIDRSMSISGRSSRKNGRMDSTMHNLVANRT